MKKKKEYILCAAIHFDDSIKHEHQPKNIKTGFVICGRRHHNCIAILRVMNKRVADFVKTNGKRMYKQGFITNMDRFVDRTKAFEIASKAAQIKDYGSTPTLFSEDLY
jgi:hypothetical protein